MEAIPNQPVSFNENPTYYLGESECSTDEISYNQLVDNTDITQFQLAIAPCDDAVEALENPTFAGDTGWDIVGNWDFGINRLCATQATTEIISTDVLVAGYWRIKVTVDEFEEGIIDIIFENVIGGATTIIGTISATGTYYFYGFAVTGGAILHIVPSTVGDGATLCLTEVSAYPILTELEIKIFDDTENEVASIDYVADAAYFTFVRDTVTVDINWAALGLSNNCYFLMAINPCTGGQLISNMFKVGDYASQCTLLINACNNNDSFGFVFTDSGFSPRIRVEAIIKTAQYLNDKNIFENSIGTKGASYFKRRKTKILAIDLQPEYVHDFLSLLQGFDNVYISNVAYFIEDDEYTISYNNTLNNFGSVTMQISEKTQNVKNILCTDNVNSCNLEA